MKVDEPMKRVLEVFEEMKSDTLDLHALFEAGGNEPLAREEVIDVVARLVRQGYLESRGSDFYSLTDKARVEMGGL
jgi:DNA-binding IclR family transcriptional regulator